MIVGVAARTITADAPSWERVARRVHQRRLELGLTATETVDRAGDGLSAAVLSLIENARKDRYSARTIAALCRGLAWSSDSVERILDGGEPTETAGPDRTIEERLAVIEAELVELRALVESSVVRHDPDLLDQLNRREGRRPAGAAGRQRAG